MSGSHCLWRSRHPAGPKVEGPECRDRVACGDRGTQLNPGRIRHSWSSFMHYRSGSRVTGLRVPVVFHIVFLFAKVGERGLGCTVGRSGFSSPSPRLAVEQTFLGAVASVGRRPNSGPLYVCGIRTHWYCVD